MTIHTKGDDMPPDPTNLLEIAGISTALVGFYDVPDFMPFQPFTELKRCIFSAYNNWQRGESVCISRHECSCRGGGYWIGGREFVSREKFTSFLSEREGLKSSLDLMNQWLNNQKPYLIEYQYVVMGPLNDDQYDYLKSVTFFVNPDQLSLLLLGTEYHNASIDAHPAITTFGSGCGQLAAVLGNIEPNVPKAVIGTTDIAMRQYLPPDILALTVNKPMYQQLCELDEKSFLYKPFWKRLMETRESVKNT